MAHAFRFLALASTLAVACGGGVAGTSSGSSADGGSPTSATTPSDCPTDYCSLRCSGNNTPLYSAACQLPACSCLVGITPRSDWAGTYHLPDKPDATNLVLEADGNFHWTIDGCDFGGGDCGIWKKSQPHTIVLLPSTSGGRFFWNDVGGVSATDSINVVGDPNGELVVEVPDPGHKPNAQRWKKGRVCAVCGGSEGPTGQEPCSAPVETRCRNGT